MEDPKATSRYATACRECSTTKAKCIRKVTGDRCERCTRLNKECRARVPVARAPRAPKPNRLTQMEQKLDGLVTMLSSSQLQVQPAPTQASIPFMTPNSLSPGARTCEHVSAPASMTPVGPLQEETGKCRCSGDRDQVGISSGHMIGALAHWPLCQGPFIGNGTIVLDLNDEVAAALLENYQESMAKYFPFVVIPPSTTAQQLRISKPFLFLSVMAVSYYQLNSQQTTLSAEIMRRLSDQMLFRGEKSLDLLQGILIYAEWYHTHKINDPQLTITIILQLSVALLVDLGLNKAPQTSEKNHIVPDAKFMVHGNPVTSQVRTNDERRAFLGCFYLASAISSCLKKLEAPRYTCHMEESCEALSRDPEYDSDKYLVQLVRLHQITEKITQTLPHDAPESFWALKPPIGLLVNVYQAELQSFQRSLPENLQHDPAMTLHLKSTELHLLEISLRDWSRHSTLNASPSSRIVALNSALLAANAFFKEFFSLPISTYPSFPFITWGQIANAMQVLSKLSLLNDVLGWDLAYVREVMDFSVLLDQMTQRFEEAREMEERAQRERGNEVAKSRYEMFTLRLRHVKVWFQAKLGVGGGGGMQAAQGGLAAQNGEVGVSFDANANFAGHGGQGESGDEYLSAGSGMMYEMDAAYWHDFLEEWGSF